MGRLSLTLVAVLVTQMSGGLPPHRCMGAQVALAQTITAMAAQEHQTPEGEWCQRATATMPKQAHACQCHKHDCTDKDPDHVSAHTDGQCLNYCTVSKCACAYMDCP